MSVETLSILSISLAALDAALCIGVLLLPIGKQSNPAPHITLRRVLLIGLALAVFMHLKVLWFSQHGATIFGVIHLLFWEMSLVPPLAGVVLLLASRKWDGQPVRHVSLPVLLLAWGSLLIPPTTIFASMIEPFRLQLERTSASLPPERQGKAPVRIGVLADIQTDRVTDHERRAVRMLMAENPDIILLTGDLFQDSYTNFRRELPELRSLFKELSAPGGVYCVPGNLDPVSMLAEVVKDTQVQLLINRTVETVAGDRRLTIGGTEFRFDNKVPLRTIAGLEHETGPGDIRILVTHNPDAVYCLGQDSRVDLVVSGHTHGGQIRLPLIGALAKAGCRIPRSAAGGGLHGINGNRLYVSRGVGWERSQAPRIRFLCPPEVSIITLE